MPPVQNTAQQSSDVHDIIHMYLIIRERERDTSRERGRERKEGEGRERLTHPSSGIFHAIVKTGSKNGTTHASIRDDRGAYSNNRQIFIAIMLKVVMWEDISRLK